MSVTRLPSPPEEVDRCEARLLERAIVKLVLYGHKVGVTAEEMISLLDSGMTTRELLEFLAARGSGSG